MCHKVIRVRFIFFLLQTGNRTVRTKTRYIYLIDRHSFHKTTLEIKQDQAPVRCLLFGCVYLQRHDHLVVERVVVLNTQLLVCNERDAIVCKEQLPTRLCKPCTHLRQPEGDAACGFDGRAGVDAGVRVDASRVLEGQDGRLLSGTPCYGSNRRS